ncbi:MAG TPA: hypothetical protein VFW19_10665 [Allosphingosinicella sp.]|nr:hypothetical protein [Allosphingosinicella sp.]
MARGGASRGEPKKLEPRVLAIRESAESRLRALPAPEERERIKAARRTEQREADERAQGERLRIAARWSHKNEGTAQTHDYASKTRQGALARLFLAGDISRDEWAWAGEIAMAAEAIERDVAVRIVGYEMRIDCSASGRNEVREGPLAIRMQVAYSHWRRWLPDPKRMILDMIVGEPKPYSAAAKEYGVHKRKSKRLLLGALQMWPDALEAAEVEIEAARAGIL